MSDFKATGGCLCGGVKYEYTSRPTQMMACHCTVCRKALGAPFGVYVDVNYPSDFNFIRNDTLRQYKTSDVVERSFCGVCGGGLFDRISFIPDKIYITAGSIDGDPGVRLQGHMYVKHKACWVNINDGLPQFYELPGIHEHEEK